MFDESEHILLLPAVPSIPKGCYLHSCAARKASVGGSVQYFRKHGDDHRRISEL